MAPDVSETVDGIEAQIDSVLQQRDLNWIDILNDLIVKLLNIGNRTNSLQYLNRVIAKIEEIVQDIGDHEVDNKMLNNLGSALLMRYERTADVKDLKKAISYVAEAIENTLPSDPDLARRMSNLNKMRLQQYRRTANMDYLEAAIFDARETIENALVGPLDRVFLLADLSTALSQQYEQTHNEGTLNESISLAIEAIRLTAQHIVDGENDSKSNVEDLKESISIIQKSITPLSKQSEQSEWVRRLSNLGSLLYLRYERRHDPSDLNDAISTMGIAKSLTAQDHPDSNSLLNNLGAILFSKYETTHEMSDLVEAISKASEAVKATPNSHPDLPGRLSNLSNMLFKQYEVTFDLDHLKKSHF
ncbi:hypothetical protein NUW58_g1306 [Xylaria curta]|uniref:Uncharacterized protein n=1 Tax=Xylaria curta TaxID=42375 RepID=A0ACC1PNH6_9PEZI|nr:hypothetical protein NUW58_g1306 [Xylaria curta]